MNDSPTVGLRERKRAQTSEAIHVAAVELVFERGLDEATIEAICERADVSNRTFFNYFSSKEDAVLGIDEAAVSAELDTVRHSGGDPLAAVFDMIYAVFEASGGKHKKTDLTREVMRKHPQLMTRQMVRVAALEDRLSGIIAAWLADDPRFAADSDEERLDEARIILGICLATVRVSMKKWAGGRRADGTAEGLESPDKAAEGPETADGLETPGNPAAHRPGVGEDADANHPTAGGVVEAPNNFDDDPQKSYERAIATLRTVLEKLK
jgi:AcrR family transcriptional regulator